MNAAVELVIPTRQLRSRTDGLAQKCREAERQRLEVGEIIDLDFITMLLLSLSTTHMLL